MLTGRPGVGKTTIVKAVVARLGERAGGFYTEEIREAGQRTGFRLVAFGAGRTRSGILAGVDISSPYRVGRYRVCVDDLESVGVRALWQAMRQPGVNLLVIDEIGKMELMSAAFCEAVEAAMQSAKPVLATVMASSQRWVNDLKVRPEVQLVEVTPANREDMAKQVLGWLTEM